jgi:FG-GAP-like repeat
MTEAATESPLWLDLDGDGKKELVCMQGGKYGYATVDYREVTKPWVFTAISDKVTNTPYIHGLGAGDLSGDRKPDIVCKDGWYEQPSKKGESWTWHPEPFAGPGGAQMLVFDADGDGDNDMVTSLNGHGYGLVWFSAARKDGKVTFTRHEILPEDPAKTGADGLQFSQLHALEAGDFDGDGRMDFTTGKRYYAHNGNDPGAEDPALAVIFYNRKDGDGVRWQAEVIDNDSGVGCQVLAVDLDGDGKLEFAAGNKKGVHVISR